MNCALIISTATLSGALLVSANTATADEGCTTVDYQGAPLEMCPPVEPDQTNCYTGDYQGAPIEICLPTDERLPAGTTYNGAPVVYHVSKDYVPPAPSASAPAQLPAPRPPAVDVAWVADYVALLG